jgi:Zn-finger nucleic acid-binding protein
MTAPSFKCPRCGNKADALMSVPAEVGKYACPKCMRELLQTGKLQIISHEEVPGMADYMNKRSN